MSSRSLLNPLLPITLSVLSVRSQILTQGEKKEYFEDALYYFSKHGLLNQPPDLQTGVKRGPSLRHSVQLSWL